MLPTGAARRWPSSRSSAFGRVPTMLNFTSGHAGLKSALRTAQVKRVVTARRFVDLAQAGARRRGARERCEIVYLEDVRAKLSLSDKLAAAVGQAAAARWWRRSPHPDKPAAILFTSGTEGEPKGVALSHANILANVAQVRAHIDLYPRRCAVQSPARLPLLRPDGRHRCCR